MTASTPRMSVTVGAPVEVHSSWGTFEWLLHEHVRRQDIGYMAALGIGMALFFAGRPLNESDPWSDPVLAGYVGGAWFLGLAAWAFPWLGLNPRDDVAERRNRATLERLSPLPALRMASAGSFQNGRVRAPVGGLEVFIRCLRE